MTWMWDAGTAAPRAEIIEPTEGIYYAKIRGNVALRPRLCLGPRRPDDEVTFLERATEINFKVLPKDACERAHARMKILERDDSRRLLIRFHELA